MADLQKSFRKLINANFINYEGCLLERNGTEWKALNKWYPSLEDAKKAIDDCAATLAESINRTKQTVCNNK